MKLRPREREKEGEIEREREREREREYVWKLETWSRPITGVTKRHVSSVRIQSRVRKRSAERPDYF